MFRSLTHYAQMGAGALLDVFYPRHCYHCDRPLNDCTAQTLCHNCFQHLKRIRIRAPICKTCGLPLPGQKEHEGHTRCLNCRMLRPPFSAARALFPYSGPPESLVQSYKYHGNYFLGPRVIKLAIQMQWVSDSFIQQDCIVPVPLHPRRKRQRGYNQATFIAQVLGQHYSIPLASDTIIRKRHTDQQARLTRAQRQKNVKGAFGKGPEDVSGKSVLLVDDVLTTGATVGECARTLRRAGADRVNVLTLVRACK